LIVWQVRDGWVPLLERGLASAELDGDPGGQSRPRALLGWVLSEEGRPAEALVQLERAPELAALAGDTAGDTAGEAIARINLTVALTRSGAAERGARERGGGHDRDGAGERGGGRERARDLLVRALALAERAGHTETATLARQHLTHHLLANGSPAEAAAHALAALGVLTDR
ncbi:hypothetical protein AMK15_23345, partial [Streptomyces sp. MJM1172]